jgi:hypothetical protein
MSDHFPLTNLVAKLAITPFTEKYTEEYIEENADSLDWSYASFYIANFSHDFVERFLTHWDWKTISNRQLSEEFIIKFEKNINWDFLSHVKRSIQFLEKYHEKIDMEVIYDDNIIDEVFFDRMKDLLDWDIASEYYKFSIEQLEKYEKYINWELAGACQTISYELLHKYADRMDWTAIINTKYLPEDIIIKYQSFIIRDLIKAKKQALEEVLEMFDSKEEAKEFLDLSEKFVINID